MIIGLAGSKGSGKTTIANLICKEHPTIKHLSFAAPMREMVCRILGCTEEELEREKETPIAWLGGITPRKMLQTLGTEWGRILIHQGIWVNVCIRDALLSTNVIISDVRFDNEAHAIRQTGGLVFYIESHTPRQNTDSHISESGVSIALIKAKIQNVPGLPSAAAAEILSYFHLSTGVDNVQQTSR